MSGFGGQGTASLGLVLIPALTPYTQFSGAFAGVPPATLQQFLADAQTALHALTIGGQPVTVAYGEGSGQKSVTYARTNEAQLRKHITELQILLGLRSRRHAARVI